MKIAFCDDMIMTMSNILNAVKDYYRNSNTQVTIDTYTNPAELITAVVGGKRYVMYFIDYDMPQINGEELAIKIRNYDKNAIIAYASMYDNVGSSACRAGCDMYLYKQFSRDQILSEITRVDKIYKQRANTYDFTVPDGVQRVHIKNILYVESLHRKIYVHTFAGTLYVLKCTLSDLACENVFSEFVRVSRSYLINCDHIDRFIRMHGSVYAVMLDGEQIKLQKSELDCVFYDH